MNGHQNEAFSCLTGALNDLRKVNGYGADYARITLGTGTCHRIKWFTLNGSRFKVHGEWLAIE